MLGLGPPAHLPKVTLMGIEPGPRRGRKDIMKEQQGSDEHPVKSHLLKKMSQLSWAAQLLW